MSWLDKLIGGKVTNSSAGGSSVDAAAKAAAAARGAEWERALSRNTPPDFVVERLEAAAAGRAPWMATMTPAELRLARSHGVRPLATVSGTCWFHFGWSWTQGHAEGWESALGRIRREAVAVGANAIVDVRMRTIRQDLADSMDFTLLGTAIKLDGLPPSPDPVVATVPALEFVRLLEVGIVPVGLAVGAHYETLDGNYFQQPNVFMGNQRLNTLSEFWERIRRSAHARLRESAAAQGNGVLAHVHFGQLLTRERDKQPPIYLGRHIVIGTVVSARRGDSVTHPIGTAVDMRDDESPLTRDAIPRHNAYDAFHEEEGAI
jgi:uncharacterized protein YbjQ (UPF0145 family)